MAVSTSVLDMLAKGPKPLGPVVAEGLRYRQPRAEGASKNLEQQNHLVEKSRPSGLARRKNSCECLILRLRPNLRQIVASSLGSPKQLFPYDCYRQ